ncbi:MAG TPA: radical SAM family heme chaperone HemW [Stellaceae bacterium]|jgi:oxygen-independent coproporphyrinogen-3 oxidase|nr:radical SAM family heme chaperone HemW [Stellaceae bacterium]
MATPFALYIHWPFCKSKCPYCDFNSHVRDSIDQGRWQRTLLAELDHWAPALKGRELVSIFFGGGTPSLMAPATAAALIERATQHWSAARDLEITLEANPTSVEAARFAELRAAGVNRVSLGVQALDDASLKFLGRGHNVVEARDAVKLAARLFDRFSFDLIYARPGQTLAAWRDELRAALTMAGDHLSLYQLTIEPGTAFATAFARGDFRLPDDETQGALYETTQETLAAAGLPAYEISNHARPGQECRHNLVYWRYQDYLGIGPGAHGRLTLSDEKRALKNFRAPETWLKAVERDGHGVEETLLLSAGERRDEMLMMGLRLGEGVTRDAFRAEAGIDFEQMLDAARLAKLTVAGFLALDETGIRATNAGRQRLNAVLGALLA